MNRIYLLFLLLIGVSACNKDNKLDEFSVVYELEYIATWSATTHPTDFPSNAHFSPFVAVSHLSSAALFLPGFNAGEGIQQMAETGETSILNNEIDKWINTSIAIDKAEANLFDSPGNSSKVKIGVRSGYQTVTVVSMIAPSPDWFVAATTSLVDPVDGLWYDEVITNAISYDAGTDSGLSFSSANEATDPVEGVSYISTGPLTEGTDTVVNMGYFRFTRIQ